MKETPANSWARKKYAAAILVFAISMLALWLSYRTNNPWWQSLLSNMGAGLVSALLLIFLYDRVIERQTREAYERRNMVAAEQLITPLRSHMYGTLLPMYRSAVEKTPAERINSWQDFLTRYFPYDMQYLDIAKPSPGSFPAITPYPKFITENFGRFTSDIQSWLTKYGGVVNSELVDALERLRASGLMMLACSLDQFISFVPPPPFPQNVSWISAFHFQEAQCVEYGVHLSKVIDLVDQSLDRKISEFEEIYWKNELFPIGHARHQMAHFSGVPASA